LANILQHHWVRKLLGFDFSVVYKAGSTNTVADMLSHHDTEEAMVLTIFGPHFDFIDRLRQANDQDPALVAIKA
jgi:lipopolysaccharide biosynthesis protein